MAYIIIAAFFCSFGGSFLAWHVSERVGGRRERNEARELVRRLERAVWERRLNEDGKHSNGRLEAVA